MSRLLDFSDGFESSVQPTTVVVPATEVSVTPSGNLASTTAQAALVELQSDVDTRATSLNPVLTGTLDSSATTTSNVSTSNTASAVSIGTGSGANTINIGGANSTIILSGTSIVENTVNKGVQDKLITINKGGATLTGGGTGLEIEEAATITGYVKTKGDRSGFEFKAPSTAGIVTLNPGAANDTLALLNATQTFTGKTFTSPVINTPTGITKADVGLGSVDNTSDLGKPISTATQSALNLKQDAATAVTLTGAQTLSGPKTLTAPILTTPVVDILSATEQASAPASPTAGTRKVYVKTDGKMYLLDSTGTETAIGTGSGGGVNYVLNPDFDANTTGWVISKNTTATVAPDAGFSTAAVTNTITRSTTLPLRGAASGLFTLGAVGNQLYYPIAIADADKGKVLAVTFDYAVSSGTYADDSVQIWIYDVTNNVFIQPAPYKLKNHTLASERMFCEFQTSSSSTSYRLVLHQALASTAVLKIDNFTFGPQGKLYGSAITDPVSYVPTVTGLGTVSLQNVSGYRNGKFYIGQGVVTNGTVAGSNVSITLPSGLTIDSSLPVSATGYAIVGQWARNATSALANTMIAPASGNVVYASLFGGGTRGALTPAFGTDFGNSESQSFYFKVPILGWGSQSVMSNDADTRVVSTRVRSSAGVAVASSAAIIFNTKDYDTTGSYNTTTGQYLVAIPGYYEVGGTGRISTATSGNFMLYKNGALDSYLVTANQNIIYPLSGGVQCIAGDLIDLRFDQAATITAEARFTIKRTSGPSQIAASEVVSTIVHSTTGMSVPANAVWTKKTFDTIDDNSHGSWSSNRFTAQRAGLFEVSYSDGFNNNTAAVNFMGVSIYKNGVRYKRTYSPFLSNAYDFMASVSSPMKLITGDYLEFYVLQTHSAALTTLGTDVGFASIVSK